MNLMSPLLTNSALGTCAGASLAAMLLGCSGGAPSLAQPADESPGLMLSAPSHLACSSGADFLTQQNGAEFAADLAVNRVSPYLTTGRFSPIWDDTQDTTALNAAYCLYRLSYDPDGNSGELLTSWDTAAPAPGTCWVGLSNWASDAWDWFELPADDRLALADTALYRDLEQHSFVAVVMLGTAQVELATIGFGTNTAGGSYVIVDTNQQTCYDDTGQVINPSSGQAYFGQDAQYDGVQPAYLDNGDGTVTDLNTGLIWQQSYGPGYKLSFDDALSYADNLVIGEDDDWRLPTIKELYSLMDFTGVTGMSAATSIPYIDTGFFEFDYGDESVGERFIDAQFWSANEYVSTTMGGDATVFGVNFADGRIKGYPKAKPPTMQASTMFFRCVRGNPDYGMNDFVDNGDETISDTATGLTWMQTDSVLLNAGPRGDGLLNWEEALDWTETLDYAGHDDWRLPDAKELESIVDYARSPDTTDSAAIDPLFQTATFIDGNGLANYHFYWSGTTHLDGMPVGKRAVYLSFGEALGWMEQPPGSANYQLLDVHGAGAQRSDPKSGDPDDFPYGHGPQGDVIRIYNCVRCVRGSSG